MLLSFEEPERPVLCAAIAEVELANAAVAAPAIERFREWKTWLQLALQCSMTVLQARVSEALEALSRGREPSPPGERFRRDVLAAIPDIEAMELVERFFAIGRSAPIHGFREGCDRPKPWKSECRLVDRDEIPTTARSGYFAIAETPLDEVLTLRDHFSGDPAPEDPAPDGKERLFWPPGPLAKELRRLCPPMPVPVARGRRWASHPEGRGRQIPKD